LPDFLDILPPERTETITVFGHEFPIKPLKNSVIASIARRFPELRKSLFKDAPEDFRGLAMMEAMPAIVAAGLGMLGDKAFEAAIEARLPQPEMMRIGGAIMALTYPSPEEADAPLATAAEIVAAAEAEAATEITSEPQ
jgi:hypothetical protein